MRRSSRPEPDESRADGLHAEMGGDLGGHER